MKEFEIVRKEKQETYKVIVDDRDIDLLTKYTYHAQVNLSGHVYIRRWLRIGRSYRHVNLQWDVYTRYNGEMSFSTLIDHSNGNTLDNRLTNLRLATRQQNRFNSKPRSNSSSKYKGVVANKNGWSVFIHYGNRHITCGTFEDEVKAAKLADKIYMALYGKFAYLNFQGTENVEI